MNQQVNWLKKQKRICKIYGQPLSQVMTNVMHVSETKQSKEFEMRLKGLDAELL